ncbi:hypothetical protein Mucpa_5977 [Mucilaginibacter paludis DSM 18603]|uniref:Uncharacterized protein n=1 Tax=Mucilaginibacter paludis DSM 18603 TaxID=714943 RepID=H1YB04_9SPHI|nr:hypothetical protein Mucpa_5977 [Mucilaginibacter paludis DSM 18603]
MAKKTFTNFYFNALINDQLTSYKLDTLQAAGSRSNYLDKRATVTFCIADTFRAADPSLRFAHFIKKPNRLYQAFVLVDLFDNRSYVRFLILHNEPYPVEHFFSYPDDGLILFHFFAKVIESQRHGRVEPDSYPRGLDKLLP